MDITPRRASILAAVALLGMVPLGPLAAFGILPDGAAGLAMTVVVALDVLAAVALWRVLGPGMLSLLAAALRLVYSAALLVAAGRLAAGDRGGFEAVWDAGLGVFGLHLVALGFAQLAVTGIFARLTAAFVVVAGLGYAADSAAALLVPRLDLGIATVTFVGELVLVVWLLVRGGRREDDVRHQEAASRAARPPLSCPIRTRSATTRSQL